MINCCSWCEEMLSLWCQYMPRGTISGGIMRSRAEICGDRGWHSGCILCSGATEVAVCLPLLSWRGYPVMTCTCNIVTMWWSESITLLYVLWLWLSLHTSHAITCFIYMFKATSIFKVTNHLEDFTVYERSADKFSFANPHIRVLRDRVLAVDCDRQLVHLAGRW